MEDPEQQKLKEKARALQQKEYELAKQKEANKTALAAIGPRKRPRFDHLEGDATEQLSGGGSATGGGLGSGSNAAGSLEDVSSVNNTSGGVTTRLPSGVAASGAAALHVLRPRIKRVNLRDLSFLLERDYRLARSTTLTRCLNK